MLGLMTEVITDVIKPESLSACTVYMYAHYTADDYVKRSSGSVKKVTVGEEPF